MEIITVRRRLTGRSQKIPKFQQESSFEYIYRILERNNPPETITKDNTIIKQQECK